MEVRLTSQWQNEIDLLNQTFAHPTTAQPGLSFSIKTSWKNYSNHEEPLLLFAQADWDAGNPPTAADWVAYRLNPLKEMIEAGILQPEWVQEALVSCILSGSKISPSPAVLIHAASADTYTSFTQPPSLLATFCQEDGEENLKAWLGSCAHVLPFLANLPELCQLIYSQVTRSSSSILMNRGLLVTSDDLNDCIRTQGQVTDLIETHFSIPKNLDVPSKISLDPWEILPGLRAALSHEAGYPLILHLDQSEHAASLIKDAHTIISDLQRVPLPDFAAIVGTPLLLNDEVEAGPSSKYSSLKWNEDRPCQILFSKFGIIATGHSVQESFQATRVASTVAAVAQKASQSGKWKPLDPMEVKNAQIWQMTPVHPKLPFSGEIALVTGAASGIGKACANSLLSRGAAVVGLDINPDIEHTFDHPCYTGMICDITNEANIKTCLHETVRLFGGLDILVLNAGMFPSGCNIQSISLTDFTRVINVNLSANLVLMREAYPLLKKAPRYGRVVMVGSKNTKAPGPGAVAYSTSKAALTQMARVAAMEWAADNIRVNVIHPDAVFDTGLYTEEVLKARASYYGLSVEQYKKRNMLKIEITSHDVGEMVAEMCGQVFRVVTGAQIQFDGGNERTI